MKHYKSSLATYIKKTVAYSLIVFVAIYLSSCESRAHHADDFYNDDGDFPYVRFPLIKSYYVDARESPWTLRLKGYFVIYDGAYAYSYGYNMTDVRKLSVESHIIMAYSPYNDGQPFDNTQVIPSNQEDYYPWFVIIPDKKIEAGFQNESAFLEYVHGLGIQQPDWQTPDDLFGEFAQTGCLSWIPDCK